MEILLFPSRRVRTAHQLKRALWCGLQRFNGTKVQERLKRKRKTETRKSHFPLISAKNQKPKTGFFPLWFFGQKKGSLGKGRAFETGITLQLHLAKPGALQKVQELHSRYGPAGSLVPVFNPTLPFRRQSFHQHHVGQHDPAAGFQHPVNLLHGLFLV